MKYLPRRFAPSLTKRTAASGNEIGEYGEFVTQASQARCINYGEFRYCFAYYERFTDFVKTLYEYRNEYRNKYNSWKLVSVVPFSL